MFAFNNSVSKSAENVNIFHAAKFHDFLNVSYNKLKRNYIGENMALF